MESNRVCKLKITKFSESYNYEKSVLTYYNYEKKQYGHGFKFFFKDLKKEIENNIDLNKRIEIETSENNENYKNSFKIFNNLMNVLVCDGLSCWDDYGINLDVLNGRLLSFMGESEKRQFYSDSRVRVVGSDFYQRLSKHFKEFWDKEIKAKN
jgi:hypothetical protein